MNWNFRHGTEKQKKWSQELYKLCDKLLRDGNKAIPAERAGWLFGGKNAQKSTD
jgi:hypothetical protein